MAADRTVPLGPFMTAVDITPSGRATEVHEILDRHGGRLGVVKWYGAWRQYAFFPDADNAPVFNPDCLSRLAAFAALGTRLHRERNGGESIPPTSSTSRAAARANNNASPSPSSDSPGTTPE